MSQGTEHGASCCGDCTNCGCDNAGGNAPGVPISMARVGERGTIVRVSGKEDTRKFLAGLGFTAGATVSTVCRASGNLILDVKGSKIAIDKRLASKILFNPES